MFLTLISGLAGIFAFPPAGFYPLAFVFLVPYFVFLIREGRPGRLIIGSFLFKNLRRIMSVWQGIPVVANGRSDYAGIILPDGKSELLNFKNPQGFAIYKGEARF